MYDTIYHVRNISFKMNNHIFVEINPLTPNPKLARAVKQMLVGSKSGTMWIFFSSNRC